MAKGVQALWMGVMAEAMPTTLRMLKVTEPMGINIVADCHVGFAFSGCHDGGEEFGEGGADGDDSESDDAFHLLFFYAEVFTQLHGDSAGAVDEEVGAPDHGCQGDEDEEDGAPEGHEGGGLRRGRSRGNRGRGNGRGGCCERGGYREGGNGRGGGALGLAAGAEDFPGDEGDEEGDHEDAEPAVDGAEEEGTEDEEGHGEKHEGDVDEQHHAGGREGMDEGCEAKDEGNVGDIGACDVADGES